MKRTFLGVAVCILGLVAGMLPAQAQVSAGAPPQYYAASYGAWQMRGQAPNTYVFNGRYTCNQNAAGATFFPFATNAPVYIQDATTANSEVVTPSAVVQNGGTCGFTASPAHTHNSFWLLSGSAGLQESLNALGAGSTAYVKVLVLDQNWYTAALNVPGTTPAAIIAAAAGNSHIAVVDLTTAPATTYTWDGSKYSATSDTPFFNKKPTSYTVVSAPAALTTAVSASGMIATATTGGTIPASATYRLAATYVDASGGETLISTDTASTATIATGSGTATNTISVTSPAAASGAVGWRLYMTAASGSAGAEILYTPTCAASTLQSTLPGVCAIGASATITAIVTGTATVPAINTAYPRTNSTTLTWPPFTALGTVNAAATGTLATVNFPAGYFNRLGRSVQLCGNGFATTNSTAGTLTLAAKYASVPGVTSITPFSVVSGATAASAQADPFNFCVTISTAATGATGTLEVHGWVVYSLSGTAAGTAAQDIVTAVSSAVDLTKQGQIQLTITPATTALTAAQVRQLTITAGN